MLYNYHHSFFWNGWPVDWNIPIFAAAEIFADICIFFLCFLYCVTLHHYPTVFSQKLWQSKSSLGFSWPFEYIWIANWCEKLKCGHRSQLCDDMSVIPESVHLYCTCICLCVGVCMCTWLCLIIPHSLCGNTIHSHSDNEPETSDAPKSFLHFFYPSC